MVRKPRRPTHEDEPDEPVAEPEPEPQEEPMPPTASPAPQSVSGNGGHAAPRTIGGSQVSATSDQQATIAQQQILIATQAQAVRDLELALGLNPPPPTTPPPPPPAGVNLNIVITTQTGAIRTQAAYIQHLQDLQTALAG